MSSDLPRVRIFVLGDTGVGKTALCRALCSHGRSKDSAATGSDGVSWTVGCRIHVRKQKVDENTTALVEFCDIGGSAKFEHSRTVFLRRLSMDGIILVHDLTWLPSRASIRRLWLPELARCTSQYDRGGYQTLEDLFPVDEDIMELGELLSALRRCDFRRLTELLRRIWDKILELGKSYLRDFTGDDMQERMTELDYVRQIRVPMLMVGMKRDQATRAQRKAAKAEGLPGVPYAEVDVASAPTNPAVSSFLQLVVQSRLEGGGAAPPSAFGKGVPSSDAMHATAAYRRGLRSSAATVEP